MERLSIERTFFEEHGEEMLATAGYSKAQFAKVMGVAPQNISKLFSTKNALTLAKVGKVLNVTLHYLVHGEERVMDDIHGCLYFNGTPFLINSRKDLEDFLRHS